MKTKTLSDSIRQSADVNRKLVLPPGSRTYRSQPLCMTCGREVEAVALENVNNWSCEIRCWCTHGTETRHEDTIKVTWDVPVRGVGNDILEDPNVGWAIKRAMSDVCAFPKEHHFDFSSKR